MKININDKMYRFCFWSDAQKQIPKSSKYYPIVSSRMWQVSRDQDTPSSSSNDLSLKQCQTDLDLIQQIRPYTLISNHTMKILTEQLRSSITKMKKHPNISVYEYPEKQTNMTSKVISLSAVILAVFSVIIFIAKYFIQSDALNYIDMASFILLVFCCTSLLLNVPKL